MEFTQDQLYYLHHILFDITGITLIEDEELIIFNKLPENIKAISFKYGFGDSIFKWKVFDYFKSRRNDEPYFDYEYVKLGFKDVLRLYDL